ncbi:hypothetical protein FA95DRAFT_1567937 [Auriscalpium vulgare]|uniref:Uncharacterized protein n=1 Tax=Auriscalpium vulgare TaxID=40419 RepID=A0ACB8R2C6_9AGAM|nr:hypothetical protein FA95DRAFT_1567937 [Auriscalpium vulgare]
MRDFYTICNPGPGVPESPPEPKSEHKYEPMVRDPNAGLTPAEAERLEWFEEGIRSKKLFYEGLRLVSVAGGRDHWKEYWALLDKNYSGLVKQSHAILEPKFMELAFSRAACERMALECWEGIAAIKQERMRGEGH